MAEPAMMDRMLSTVLGDKPVDTGIFADDHLDGRSEDEDAYYQIDKCVQKEC